MNSVSRCHSKGLICTGRQTAYRGAGAGASTSTRCNLLIMAVLPILTQEAPILRQKAKRVARVDSSIRKLIDDMVDTMIAAPGIALAAPQVGVGLRVLVYK